MAAVIAIAEGHNANGSTKCSRLASQAGEAQVNTRKTFVTVRVEKDGATKISVSRSINANQVSVLTTITLNSEHAAETIITADGLLRESIVAGYFEDSASARTLESDLAEDRP